MERVAQIYNIKMRLEIIFKEIVRNHVFFRINV